MELASNVAVFTVWADAVKTCSSEPRREEKSWFEEPGLAMRRKPRGAASSRPFEKASSALTRWRSPMEWSTLPIMPLAVLVSGELTK